MLPSQMISPFDYFKKMVKQLYPEVSHLEIDHWSFNVQPIKYNDYCMERTEYPPVVSWRIGQRKYRYVLAPKFKTEYNNDLISIFSRSTVRTKVDYKDQEKIVLELIKCSVEGKTTEEMNIMLDSLRIQDEL